MAGVDDIDIFGVPVTGSTRDRDLGRLERMVRGRYIDPLEQKAKDMVKNQVVQALSGIEGVTGAAIAQVVALADSPDPNDRLVFNQIVSRLNLPINIRRMGDDYMASKRFEGALGRHSSVDVSAYAPDEGQTQYSLGLQKRFPNILGQNSSADVSARVSTMGDPEIRARFEKKFTDGGEVDIFETEVAPRRSPDAYRRDGSLKSQTGFLGPIINKHSGKPMTELSIGVEIGGQEVEIPSMVPTLTKEERILLQNLRIGVDPMPKSIVIKAKRHAIERMKAGLSPFFPAEPQNKNFGGSVGQMARRQRPTGGTSLSPAQLANIGAAFADPLGMIDITGEYPEFPAAGVSVSDMVMQGPRSPSLIENLREGDFGAAALQGIGVVPVVGGVARTVRGLSKAKSVPLEQAERMGYKSHLYDEDFNLRPLTEGARPIGVTKTPFNEAKKFSEFLADQNIMHKTDVAKTGTVYVTVEGGQMRKNLRGEPMAGEVIYRFGDHDTGFFKGRGNIQIRTDQKQSHKDAIDHLKGVENVISIEASGASSVAKGADRLAKAQKAGFDTETVYYHATDKFEGDTSDLEFTKMMPSDKGKLGPGIYMSPNPAYTEKYVRTTYQTGTKDPMFDEGARILPIFVRGKIASREDYFKALDKAPDLLKKELDELESAAQRNEFDKLMVDRQKFALQKQKARDILAEDGFSGFKVGEEVVVFDPKNIRSVNAEFEDLDSPELLKASGGAVQSFSKGGIADLIVQKYFDARFDARQKEQDMLANLEAEIIGSNEIQPKPRLALSELEGEQFVTSMADRTRAGGAVKSINRVQLVDPVFLPGGQDFMFNNPSGVWASAEQPSRQILELARELKLESGRDPLYIPWRMAPTGGDFSTTTGELMLGYAASNMTKKTKQALDKSLRDYRTKGSMKDGKRVGAGLSFGKSWFGIDDPRAVEVWRNAPDGLRKELMNMMDVKFRDKGGLSIGAARLINADPKQLMARDAGVQNVGRIFADIDIFDSAHPSYPFVVPGGGVGVLENASAATVFDLLPKARFGKAQKLVKDPANPTQQEIRALQMKPYGGTITEDILRRMEARGVDVNSIVGLTGGALTFTLLSAGLVTPQEVQAGALKEFADSMRKADEMGFKTDQVLYHGSTFDIEEFVARPNSNSDFGDGTYLTVSPSDAARNYTAEGPDLTNRIELYAEVIEDSLTNDWDLNPEFWGRLNDPEVTAEVNKLVDEFEEDGDRNALQKAAKLAATSILKGPNEGVIYPVFVNNNDFAVIGGKNRTVIPVDTEQYMKSAKEEIDRDDFLYEDDYDEAVLEYAQELENTDYESPIAELAYSLRSAGAGDEVVGRVIDSVMESGQIDLSEINDLIRGSYNEDFDTGEMLNNGQIVQDVLKDLGYKGVVDNTVGERFAGMGAGKMHTIVFPGNENLIRSINAKFDPAKADSPNILASAPPILAPAAVGLGAMGTMQEARAATLQAEGAPFEVGLDFATSIAGPIAGGIAGIAEFTQGLPRRIVGDLTGEESAARIDATNELVKEALNYEPTSELGREMSQKAQEGIAQLAAPVVKRLEPVVTGAVEQVTDPQNVSPLGLLYQGGKYLYEDIFGDAEREAAKSAMDVAL